MTNSCLKNNYRRFQQSKNTENKLGNVSRVLEMPHEGSLPGKVCDSWDEQKTASTMHRLPLNIQDIYINCINLY